MIDVSDELEKKWLYYDSKYMLRVNGCNCHVGIVYEEAKMLKRDYEQQYRDVEIIEIPQGRFFYMLCPASGGSAKLGNCNVCGNHCDVVYHQTEYKRCLKTLASIEYRKTSNDLWGHKDCLIKARGR